MTIQQILDRADYILREDLDFNFASTQGAPSTSEKVQLYNEAQRNIAMETRCLFDPRVTLDITTDTYVYSLKGAQFGRKVWKVYRVRIGDNYLTNADGREFGMWTQAEIVMLRPTWATDASSRPTAAWQVSERLYIHPAPDATAAALPGFVEATYLPANRSGSDVALEGELPEELHPAIAIEMAILAAEPSVTEAHQLRRLEMLRGRKASLTLPIKEEMDRQLAMIGSTGGLYPRDDMVLY